MHARRNAILMQWTIASDVRMRVAAVLKLAAGWAIDAGRTTRDFLAIVVR